MILAELDAAEPHTIAPPLLIEEVRERAAAIHTASGCLTKTCRCAASAVLRAQLYEDVLRTIGADRGPLGAFARAATDP